MLDTRAELPASASADSLLTISRVMSLGLVGFPHKNMKNKINEQAVYRWSICDAGSYSTEVEIYCRHWGDGGGDWVL